MSHETITIYPIPAFKDNYIWTLVNKGNNTAVIVDPGDAIPVRNYLEEHQIKPIAILITHHHWDHTNGIVGLKKIYKDIPVFAARKDNVQGTTVAVSDKDKVDVLADFPVSWEVMEIPGHTLGHVAYYAPGMVFTGDTLFAVGCGRLFEGTAAQMLSSLTKIAALPEETKIYCGHEYTLNNLRFAELVEPNNKDVQARLKTVASLRDQGLVTLPSTIGDEKKTNPFLRCQSEELKQNVEKHVDRPLKSELDVFTELRRWKDNF